MGGVFKNETYHFVDIRNKTIALGFQCLWISDDLTVSEKPINDMS